MRKTSRLAALSFAVSLAVSLAGDGFAQDAAAPSDPRPLPDPEPAPDPPVAPAPRDVGAPPAATLRPLALPPPARSQPIVEPPAGEVPEVVGPPDAVDAQLYGGIVVAGVGAALFVVAGMAVSRIDQIQDDPGFVAYRAGFLPNEDACERASGGAVVDGAAPPERIDDLCDEASRWEIANYVAMPGGVAMLGMGLYLILTSHTARVKSPVAVAPSLGPTRAGLSVTLRF